MARPGIYQHYKGQLYQVVEVATHSETREKLVVYRPLYGERELWVRPLAMFDEQIDVDGVLVPRFAWQSAGQPSGQDAVGQVPASKTSVALGQAGAAQFTAPSSQHNSPAKAQVQAPASLDEQVKRAMSSSNDKPDFGNIPLFEDQAMTIKVGVAVVVAIVLLIWLF